MSATGRPRTDPGTWGTITTTGLVSVDGKWIACPAGTKPTRWRARARVRDLDGQTRSAQKDAGTKGAAERELLRALRSRVTPTEGSTLRDTMTLGAAGELWLTRSKRADAELSERTVRIYSTTYARHVAKAPITSRTLREANSVPVLRTFLEGIADNHGSGTAKTVRTILSGILTMAVDDGVLPVNAARQVRPPKASTPKAAVLGAKRQADLGDVDPADTTRDTRRAFTRAERDALVERVALDRAANSADVADLVRWMAGLGVRMAEALGQSWDDVDLDAGTVHVRGTKSASADRVLPLAPWLLDALRARYARGVDTSRLLFSSPRTGGPRAERNVYRAMRSFLDRAGFPWATGHTFRRTVVSVMDEAGLPIALATGMLGHSNPAMTLSVYMGRRTDLSLAATVL